MRILLVEDDPLLGDGLVAGLRELGMAVDWVRDGKLAEKVIGDAPYDAAVLDLSLPRLDGMSLLARWRERGVIIPVLVLTARDAIDARVAGLDAGADDYLIKPVALVELAARLRALVRRSQGKVEPVWRYGPLEYNPAARSVRWNGNPVELTARELAILELLLANPRHVLSKAHIQEKLYDWSDEVESNSLEVHIHHLRRKLDVTIVRTVRGVGYILGLPASEP
ncbi:MAG: response regulator [Burkholderiales bacterium]|nr:response regulator [Burkholderiales bacterium]